MSSRWGAAAGTPNACEAGQEDTAPARVIIVDDDPYARRTVRDALQDAGVVVIAEAGNGTEAAELGAHYQPDVVLMDVVMPGMDGITATRKLLERAPQVKVVMLSADGNDDVALLCLRSGAVGFVSKSIDLSSLTRVVNAARDGEVVVSRRLTARLIADMRRTSVNGIGMRPVRSPLTPREWEVLDLLCAQTSTEDMSDLLFLSHETVRSHIKNILRKLGVNSRQQAVDTARQLRVGTSSPTFAAA
jgi:NarL family two-component system response regulator LiaR